MAFWEAGAVAHLIVVQTAIFVRQPRHDMRTHRNDKQSAYTFVDSDARQAYRSRVKRLSVDEGFVHPHAILMSINNGRPS